MLTNDDLDCHSNVLSEDLELPSFDLDTLIKATNNFSSENKIGEGGFGPVYSVNFLRVHYEFTFGTIEGCDT